MRHGGGGQFRYNEVVAGATGVLVEAGGVPVMQHNVVSKCTTGLHVQNGQGKYSQNLLIGNQEAQVDPVVAKGSGWDVVMGLRARVLWEGHFFIGVRRLDATHFIHYWLLYEGYLRAGLPLPSPTPELPTTKYRPAAGRRRSPACGCLLPKWEKQPAQCLETLMGNTW